MKSLQNLIDSKIFTSNCPIGLRLLNIKSYNKDGKKISGTEVQIYQYLYTYMFTTKSEIVYPSQDRIAYDLCIEQSYVCTLLKNLVNKNLIIPCGKDEKSGNNKYQINIDYIIKLDEEYKSRAPYWTTEKYKSKKATKKAVNTDNHKSNNRADKPMVNNQTTIDKKEPKITVIDHLCVKGKPVDQKEKTKAKTAQKAVKTKCKTQQENNNIINIDFSIYKGVYGDHILDLALLEYEKYKSIIKPLDYTEQIASHCKLKPYEKIDLRENIEVKYNDYSIPTIDDDKELFDLKDDNREEYERIA